MKKYILAFLFSLLSPSLGLASDAPIVLEKAPINSEDMESIRRGARLFVSTCMSCHRLEMVKYDHLSKEEGVVVDKMPAANQEWWFGVQPPDLSLTARSRGVDWIYTYLHSFYKDESRPLGYNNLLVHNTSMPNQIAPWQGVQVKIPYTQEGKAYPIAPNWYDLLVLEKKGSLSSVQFDQNITDIVNYLDYAAEPHKLERIHLGKWVLGFLFIFWIFAFLLKKEYWKDVKRNKRDH